MKLWFSIWQRALWRARLNLAGLIAYDLSQRLGIPAFIVDPVVVDELDPVARIGEIPRCS